MNAEISEIIGARLLGFGMQIPELLAQRPQTVQNCGSYSFDDRITISPYRLTKKKFATPTLTPTNRPQTSNNRMYERGNLGDYKR